MREHEINKLDQFICAWYLEDTSICDKLIRYHLNAEIKKLGASTGGVNKNIKDSIDCSLINAPVELVSEYFNNLQFVTNEYIKKYPQCNNYSAWSLYEGSNIQYYPPGGGYHAWHTERSGASIPEAFRHLVYMTYLNDVTDDGETEFLHQNLKIKPEKGLTVIWPADWTYTHRGVSSKTQEKWIATGWYNFNPK
jgi:hypothetical protein